MPTAIKHGEYDPSSAEGQHVLPHVRQQTGGAVSMLPQEGKLEIDPDERLEREAEETAEQVMRGGTIGVQRMQKSDIHVRRMLGSSDRGKTFDPTAVGVESTDEPDARFELAPIDPRSRLEFKQYLAFNLKCQIRDCFVRMGVQPPKDYRVLGYGRYEAAERYNKVEFYPKYHDPQNTALLR